MTWRFRIKGGWALAVSALLLSGPLRADLVVEVDAEGTLEGAVVTARRVDGELDRSKVPADLVMVQANRQFDPFILPVPVGVPVHFPNRDSTAHHVYSFSPVGAFELPLYKGDNARPITFEKPGVVPLGCNIHDWMIGYLYVVDTPWYAQLDQNRASFSNLPPGTWTVSIWHPAIDHLPTPAWQIQVSGSGQLQTLSLDFPFATVTQPEPPQQRFDERGDY
ncbi:MAG TPA: methylamine utilization protein [Pseudomonadales bacterium]